MDRQTAAGRARQALAELTPTEDELQLVGDDRLIDVDWAWVCPWSTARWFSTRDPLDAQPPGLGPVVVVKSTGETWLLHAATPFDGQLAEYARDHGYQHTAKLG